MPFNCTIVPTLLQYHYVTYRYICSPFKQQKVLAYGVGLGDLLTNQTRLDLHQAHVHVRGVTFVVHGAQLVYQVASLVCVYQSENCLQANADNTEMIPGCPFGLVSFTGRAPQIADNTVWEMGSHDHAALRIRRHAVGPYSFCHATLNML